MFENDSHHPQVCILISRLGTSFYRFYSKSQMFYFPFIHCHITRFSYYFGHSNSIFQRTASHILSSLNMPFKSFQMGYLFTEIGGKFILKTLGTWKLSYNYSRCPPGCGETPFFLESNCRNFDSCTSCFVYKILLYPEDEPISSKGQGMTQIQKIFNAASRWRSLAKMIS